MFMPQLNYLPSRLKGMSDNDYGEYIVRYIDDYLKKGAYETAIDVINRDNYFMYIGSEDRKFLDLDIVHAGYSKTNFNNRIELKIGEILLELSEKINLNDNTLKATYIQALIRWFDVCFGYSKGLCRLIQAKQDGSLPTLCHGYRLPTNMQDYVKDIMGANKLVYRYITRIIDLDPNLSECEEFDKSLNFRKRKYIVWLISDAKKCMEQGLIEYNFCNFGALNNMSIPTCRRHGLHLNG